MQALLLCSGYISNIKPSLFATSGRQCCPSQYVHRFTLSVTTHCRISLEDSTGDGAESEYLIKSELHVFALDWCLTIIVSLGVLRID
jgi:hypothetical protein